MIEKSFSFFFSFESVAVAGSTADANVLVDHAQTYAQQYKFLYQLRDDIKDLQDKEHKRSLSSSASSYGSIEGLNKTTVCCKKTDVVWC